MPPSFFMEMRMCFKNTSSAFGAVTKLLHWTTVVLIVCIITIGLTMSDMENSPDKFRLYGLHKSMGITVLFIVCFWSVWRLVNIKPALPDTLGPLQKRGVSATKYVLLTFLFAMPLTGWGISSAAGFPVAVFDLFTMPNLLAPDKALAKDLGEIHETLAWILMGVVAVHALAALVHHFYFKDTVLRRMLPFGLKGK